MTELVRQEFLLPDQKETLRKLWNANYPASLELKTPEAFDSYTDSLSNAQHWLLVHPETIPIWAFSFVRDEETWFGIIVDTSVQRSGFGAATLAILKIHHPELNGWVIDHASALKLNGESYRSPVEFYLKNGFTLLPSERLETAAISAVKIRWRKP